MGHKGHPQGVPLQGTGYWQVVEIGRRKGTRKGRPYQQSVVGVSLLLQSSGRDNPEKICSLQAVCPHCRVAFLPAANRRAHGLDGVICSFCGRSALYGVTASRLLFSSRSNWTSERQSYLTCGSHKGEQVTQ